MVKVFVDGISFVDANGLEIAFYNTFDGCIVFRDTINTIDNITYISEWLEGWDNA